MRTYKWILFTFIYNCIFVHLLTNIVKISIVNFTLLFGFQEVTHLSICQCKCMLIYDESSFFFTQ